MLSESVDFAFLRERLRETLPGDAGATSTIFTSVLHNLTAVTLWGLKALATASAVIQEAVEQGESPSSCCSILWNQLSKTLLIYNELADTHNAESPDSL